MKKAFNRQLALAIAATLMVFTAQARSPAQDDYRAAKARISAEYKAEKTACAMLKQNAKEICLAQAEGKRTVARAELEYGHSGTPADQGRVLQVNAAADYALAKQKCEDLPGHARDVCLKQATAINTKAMVDANTSRKVAELQLDAMQKKRDADLSVAVEKCDALAGSAKASCVMQAKASFGKI